MTPVPQAAVDSAAEELMTALGCSLFENVHDGEFYCRKHRHLWLNLAGGQCQDARIIAAAVVAAVQGPIKAEALREAADEFEEFAFVDDKCFKTVNTAAVRLNAARILRAHADRIQGGAA